MPRARSTDFWSSEVAILGRTAGREEARNQWQQIHLVQKAKTMGTFGAGERLSAKPPRPVRRRPTSVRRVAMTALSITTACPATLAGTIPKC
jgi:hypothetical protein